MSGPGALNQGGGMSGPGALTQGGGMSGPGALNQAAPGSTAPQLGRYGLKSRRKYRAYMLCLVLLECAGHTVVQPFNLCQVCISLLCPTSMEMHRYSGQVCGCFWRFKDLFSNCPSSSGDAPGGWNLFRKLLCTNGCRCVRLCICVCMFVCVHSMYSCHVLPRHHPCPNIHQAVQMDWESPWPTSLAVSSLFRQRTLQPNLLRKLQPF